MTPAKPARLIARLYAAAGTVETHADEELRENLDAAFAAHGIAATLRFVPGADLHRAAEDALASAKSGEIDAIVVGGGDGSIRTVAGVLIGHDVPLGVLPLGTLNHFAKDLGLPSSVEEAVAAIAQGHLRPIDTAEVNGLAFINNSSIGLYPFMVVERERARSGTGLSKWIATVMVMPRLLRSFPIRRLHIRVAGRSEEFRSPCVFIGNNKYHLDGPSRGGRERLDAGELCLYVAKQQSRLGLMRLAFRLMTGGIDEASDLQAFHVSEAEITSRRRSLLVALDGEVETMSLPLRYLSRPASLPVYVPHDVGQAGAA
jgi:diacylglycerol kinase family enzyme